MELATEVAAGAAAADTEESVISATGVASATVAGAAMEAVALARLEAGEVPVATEAVATVAVATVAVATVAAAMVHHATTETVILVLVLKFNKASEKMCANKTLTYVKE